MANYVLGAGSRMTRRHFLLLRCSLCHQNVTQLSSYQALHFRFIITFFFLILYHSISICSCTSSSTPTYCQLLSICLSLLPDKFIKKSCVSSPNIVFYFIWRYIQSPNVFSRCVICLFTFVVMSLEV